MKINLARSAGFCFGVKRAIDMAFKTAESGSSVYMLGDIVHNELVVSSIRQAGIKKIARLGRGHGKTLLIRAHGARKDTIEKALLSGYNVIDATCPMVKEIHRIVTEMETKGYRIIIVGDLNHDEVRGIVGQLKEKALVIPQAKVIPWQTVKKIRRAAVVAQSTQNIEEVERIISLLRKKIPVLRFFNTICKPTRTKQAEIRSLPLANDAVIVIGSHSSANTRRLYELSHSLNKRTYWIETKKDLNRNWFKGIGSVGVTAGASTPDWITCEVLDYLKNL